MHSTISCHIEKPKNPITQIRLNQIHQKKTPGPINLSGETTNPYESTKYNKKTNNKKTKKQNCDLDLQSSPEQNHTSRPAENLQQNKKNKKILKQNSTKKEASASTNNSGDIAKTQEYNKKTKEQKAKDSIAKTTNQMRNNLRSSSVAE